MKAAMIFAEMRGDMPQMGNNIAAHKIFSLWRNYRRSQELLSDELMEVTQILSTEYLARLARRIYESSADIP